MKVIATMILLCVLTIPALVMASEVDNFTLRGQIPDSKAWLNHRMNQALAKAARQTSTCDVFALQKNLYRDLGGFFVARIETWSKSNPYAVFLPIDKSIYSDISNQRGEEGWRKVAPFKNYYSKGQFAFAGSLIGDDKLGHFIQMGYSMYFAVHWKANPHFPDIRNRFQRLAETHVGNYAYIRNSNAPTPLDLILEFSMFQEDTEFGMKATMVRSYADIAANYDGYRFWSSLTDGKNPYFRCVRERWRPVRRFDWSEYITPAWDEAINCSDYAPTIRDQVLRKITQRGQGLCPVQPKTCTRLYQHYGDKVARGILHPLCLTAHPKRKNCEAMSRHQQSLAPL